MNIEQSLATALCHHEAGRFSEAEAIYQQILSVQPGHAHALFLMGTLLGQRGQYDQATELMRRAIATRPAPDYYGNLGELYRRAGKLNEAMSCLRRTTELDPAHFDAWNNLGAVLIALGRFDDAAAMLGRALAIRPDFATARFNLGQIFLIHGDFARGWPLYEFRLQADLALARQFSCPQWDGGDIQGKTIFLHHEQGFGDTIQFIRYASLVSSRGARVIIGCQGPLRRLFECLPGISQIVTLGQPLPAFDLHCSLLSLPRIFGTTLQTIPATKQYLTVDPNLIAPWQARMPARNGRLNVGLAWSGHPEFDYNRIRSPFLAALAPLATAKNACFYSLQKGSPAEEAKSPPAGMELLDWTADLTDFADTAALMSNLDLIITSDTAVAHLAGALGRPTWLLLSYVPDWRWLLKREDSPWYPTMRLFRQPAPGDWTRPVEAVAGALSGFQV